MAKRRDFGLNINVYTDGDKFSIQTKVSKEAEIRKINIALAMALATVNGIKDIQGLVAVIFQQVVGYAQKQIDEANKQKNVELPPANDKDNIVPFNDKEELKQAIKAGKDNKQ